jgi:taurine dioxygenase
MGYQRIEVRPLAGALGAEIGGIDLGRELDNQTFSELVQALHDHLVVFFRDQHLTPEQHIGVARRFGGLDVHDFVVHMPGHPEIIEVLKTPEERGRNFGGVWHSDVTYQEQPALGSMLYAKEVPAFGGDTMFANQYLAFETLSPGLQKMLLGLKAVHSPSATYSEEAVRSRGDNELRGVKYTNAEKAGMESVHPVVRTHPGTGRKALFVNGVFVRRFEGWSEAESKPLLNFLFAHAVRPEFTCRFVWRKDSLAFWDNRCTQHFAINDYDGHRRYMHRVTISGDRPFLAA